MATKEHSRVNFLVPGLRRARRESMLTQQELADASGINRATISGLEHHDRHARRETVRALARALGVAPTVLMAELEEEDTASE